jgi:hypothetical protein
MGKIGAFVLSLACILMAGLNLWILFKEWFDENYELKDKQKKN